MSDRMTDIDVPDWVVEIYRRTYRENFIDGRLIKVDERINRALRAALSAWVVPVGLVSARDVERFQFSEEIEFMWPLSSQRGGDATLYTLRQEKPE